MNPSIKPSMQHSLSAAALTAAPSLVGVKLIPCDLAKYGAWAERRRLLSRWDKEIGSKAIR